MQSMVGCGVCTHVRALGHAWARESALTRPCVYVRVVPRDIRDTLDSGKGSSRRTDGRRWAWLLRRVFRVFTARSRAGTVGGADVAGGGGVRKNRLFGRVFGDGAGGRGCGRHEPRVAAPCGSPDDEPTCRSLWCGAVVWCVCRAARRQTTAVGIPDRPRPPTPGHRGRAPEHRNFGHADGGHWGLAF